MSDSNLVESSRRALLKYYNSQTMTHGGYIIALVIGVLTLISRWTAFAENIIMWKMFFILIGFLIPVSIYVFGRTISWGYLADQVLYAKLNAKDASEENIISQLHIKTAKNAQEHRFALYFHCFKSGIKYGLFLSVIPWILSFLFYLFYAATMNLK